MVLSTKSVPFEMEKQKIHYLISPSNNTSILHFLFLNANKSTFSTALEIINNFFNTVCKLFFGQTQKNANGFGSLTVFMDKKIHPFTPNAWKSV